jgi:hypothetical protein
MTVLARVYVVSKTQTAADYTSVTLQPVTTGPGNESYSKWTPSGKITLDITAPGVADFFKFGQDYDVLFTEKQSA